MAIPPWNTPHDRDKFVIQCILEGYNRSTFKKYLKILYDRDSDIVSLFLNSWAIITGKTSNKTRNYQIRNSSVSNIIYNPDKIKAELPKYETIEERIKLIQTCLFYGHSRESFKHAINLLYNENEIIVSKFLETLDNYILKNNNIYLFKI